MKTRDRQITSRELDRDDALEFGRLAFRVHQAFHQMMTQRTLEELKVTATQSLVLHLVGQLGFSNAAEISRRCCVDPKSTTHIVDRLVRDGFLVRRHNALDRRVFDLVLTKRGRAAAARVPEVATDLECKLLAGIDADEASALKMMLRQISE